MSNTAGASGPAVLREVSIIRMSPQNRLLRAAASA
jgi:hypothetical protein